MKGSRIFFPGVNPISYIVKKTYDPAQRVRVVGVVQVMGEGSAQAVVAVEATQHGAHPQAALGIFDDVQDHPVTQAEWIVWIGPKDGEMVPIVAIQAILCPEPQVSPAILEGNVDHALREALLKGERFKTQGSARGRRAGLGGCANRHQHAGNGYQQDSQLNFAP